MKNGDFMRILPYSDWKQKIAFDSIIYKEVKKYSLHLNTYERKLMEYQIDFYRTHFSLLQVMDIFKKIKEDSEKQTFIKKVLKMSENIVYIPPVLKSHFTKKIKEECDQTYQNFFLLLLDKASNKEPRNILLPLIKELFGNSLKPILKKLNKVRKEHELLITFQSLKPSAVENTARALIEENQNDLVLASIYGRSTIKKNVPISIVDEYGYGEWKSKLVSFSTNRYFIYSNNNKISKLELQHMTYLNVYPGLGHFYNNVIEDKKTTCFDNGASYLLNGWGMYCMCHSRNTAYSQNKLIEGSIIAHNLLKKNLAKAYDNIYVYLLGKYPRTKAINFMVDYTQYPAHYLSYILGEFAIENCIDNGFADSPLNFMETIKEMNMGDFFALYSPKMQRKIYKTNITAKVPEKFKN